MSGGATAGAAEATLALPRARACGRWVLPIACLCSGAAALIFENLWFRAAGLALGNSVWSVAVVTAAFMAGLGLGNAWAALGRLRVTNPARAYARVEVVIALSGLAVFALFFFGHDSIATILGRWGSTWGGLPWLRLVCAFAAFVIPSMAIGVTLPLLVVLRVEQDGGFGANLGRLYAWNTLGAVLGTLASEWLLVRFLGMGGAALAAAALNLVAAVAVGRGLRREASPPIDDSRHAPDTARPTTPRGASVSRDIGAAGVRGDAEAVAGSPEERRKGEERRDGTGLWVAAGVCGFALLALEVVWFRFMQLHFNGTGRTFAVLLGVVLGSLSMGSALASRRLARSGNVLDGSRLASACVGAGIAVGLSYALFAPGLRRIALWLGDGGVALVAASCLLMAPVCVCSGWLFTTLAAALHAREGHEMRTVGRLTLANTAGALLGSLAAGFWLLPRLGVERSLFVLALAYGCAALAIVWACPSNAEPGWRRAAPLLALGLAAAAFPFGTMARVHHADLARRLPGATLVAHREGLTESAFYFRHDSMGQAFYHRLVTHGYSMSSSDPRSRRYMKLFAWLPLALRPQAENALLICFGVGSTASALADTPTLKHIDVVDISKDILELSDTIFTGRGRHPLHDARVHRTVEDGRFFLAAGDRRYDLITGEPPPPKIAGVVNLYSRDFFRLVHSRLNEGGYCTYWLPVYQMRENEAQAIIRAFVEVFPGATLWEGGGLNWMLMGARGQPEAPSEDDFRQQWRWPEVAAEMARLGFERPEHLGTTFLAGGADLVAFCAGVAPLTDAWPRRISGDMRDRSPNSTVYRGLMETRGARERFERDPFVARCWPAGVRSGTLEAFERQQAVHYALYPEHRPEPAEVVTDARALLRQGGYAAAVLWLFGSSPEEVAIARRLEAAGGETADAVRRYHLALGEAVEGRIERATQLLRVTVTEDSGAEAARAGAVLHVLSGL